MRRPHTLVLLVLLAFGATAGAEEPPEGVEDLGRFVPYGMQVDDAGCLTWVVTRVLDGWTREPVAGATVDVLQEAAYPAPGKHGPMAEAQTDEEGWARIAFDPPLESGEWPHWIRAHHPDYASTAKFGVGAEELLLRARQESRIRVLDPLGRPVAGALLDHLLGCGHCPTVLQARTDAQGIGTLRGVQEEALAQTWLVAPGLYGEYAEHTGWLPGDAPIDHHAKWAPTFTGRIVDAEGKPVEGIAIGQSEFHRGPWTHTDKDGRFRLVGADTRPGYRVRFGLSDCTRKDWARELEGQIRMPIEGVSVVLRLPSHPDEVEGTYWDLPEPALTEVVRIDVRAPGGQALEGVPILASRISDGLTVGGGYDEEPRTLTLAPGKWLVVAGWPRPEGSDEVGSARVEIEVPRAPDAPPLQLTLPTPRRFRMALGPVARTGTVEVVTEGGTYNVTSEAQEGHPVGVPPTGAVYLRIEPEGPVYSRPRVFQVPEQYLAAGAEAFPVRMPEPVTVRMRVEAPDGTDLLTRAVGLDRRGDWQGRDDADGSPPLATTHELRLHPDSTTVIAIEPAFEAPFATRFMSVPPDAARGTTIDLGVVKLARVLPSSIRIEIPDDGPSGSLFGLRRTLRRHGITVRATAGDQRIAGELTWDEQGAWRLEWQHGEPRTIPPGAEVRLIPVANDLPAFVTRFPEAGSELRVRWPTAGLRLEVVGVDEDVIAEDTIAVDGHLIDGGPPPARVLGLAAGPHTVVASAPGYASQRHVIRLEEGQVVSRKITLRRLP